MEKGKIKVSVIMPVYNVEKFVAKTIESVLNQSLKEIEFFAIDDGSPDNSGKICDEYAKKDDKCYKVLLACNYLSCYNDRKHILQNLYGAFAIYILETADYL